MIVGDVRTFSAGTLDTSAPSAKDVPSAVEPEAAGRPDKALALISHGVRAPSRSEIKAGLVTKYADLIRKEGVRGLDDVVKYVAGQLAEREMRLNEGDRSVIHIALTGVPGGGKSFLAKVIAKVIGSELVKVRCEDIKEKHDIAKLNGTAPGYSGYGEGTLLSPKALPSSGPVVALLDEIDKVGGTTPSPEKSAVVEEFGSTFAEFVNDGELTVEGKTSRYDDVVVISTSNAGWDHRGNRVGDDLCEFLVKSFNGLFPSHFNNRTLGEVFPILPHSFDTIREIVEDTLNRYVSVQLERLTQKDVAVDARIDPELIDVLAEAGFEKDGGARRLKDVVFDKLAAPAIEDAFWGRRNGDVVQLGVASGLNGPTLAKEIDECFRIGTPVSTSPIESKVIDSQRDLYTTDAAFPADVSHHLSGGVVGTTPFHFGVGSEGLTLNLMTNVGRSSKDASFTALKLPDEVRSASFGSATPVGDEHLLVSTVHLKDDGSASMPTCLVSVKDQSAVMVESPFEGMADAVMGATLSPLKNGALLTGGVIPEVERMTKGKAVWRTGDNMVGIKPRGFSRRFDLDTQKWENGPKAAAVFAAASARVGDLVITAGGQEFTKDGDVASSRASRVVQAYSYETGEPAEAMIPALPNGRIAFGETLFFDGRELVLLGGYDLIRERGRINYEPHRSSLRLRVGDTQWRPVELKVGLAPNAVVVPYREAEYIVGPVDSHSAAEAGLENPLVAWRSSYQDQ